MVISFILFLTRLTDRSVKGIKDVFQLAEKSTPNRQSLQLRDMGRSRTYVAQNLYMVPILQGSSNIFPSVNFKRNVELPSLGSMYSVGQCSTEVASGNEATFGTSAIWYLVGQ